MFSFFKRAAEKTLERGKPFVKHMAADTYNAGKVAGRGLERWATNTVGDNVREEWHSAPKQKNPKVELWHGLPYTIIVSGARYTLQEKFDDDDARGARLQAKLLREDGETVTVKHILNAQGNPKYVVYVKDRSHKRSQRAAKPKVEMWHGLPITIISAGNKYSIVNRFDDDEAYIAKQEAKAWRDGGKTVVLKHMQNYEGETKYALYLKAGQNGQRLKVQKAQKAQKARKTVYVKKRAPARRQKRSSWYHG